jgi:chromosome segregation ATPase
VTQNERITELFGLLRDARQRLRDCGAKCDRLRTEWEAAQDERKALNSAYATLSEQFEKLLDG